MMNIIREQLPYTLDEFDAGDLKWQIVSEEDN